MASGSIYVTNSLPSSDINRHLSPEKIRDRSHPTPRSPKIMPKPTAVNANGTTAEGGRDSFDDYFTEISDIAQDEEGNDGHGSDEDQLKTPDEGEQEVVWLREAGYGHLASKFVEGQEIDEDLIKDDTSSLTRHQAAAVRKRVDTLNATIRKKQKQKQQHKADVRDVFSTNESAAKSPSAVVMRHPPEHSAQRRGSARGSAFLKRGTYSMLESEAKAGKGIETLSINSRDDRSAPESDSVFRADDKKLDSPQIKSARPKAKVGSDGLPNFVLMKDSLGVTRVSDLGKADIVKLHSLALIELTALFDMHNITYTRRKPKKKMRDSGIFGVPLQSLLDHDIKRHPSTKVPLIVTQLVQFLNKTGVPEEGILRVPGAVARIKSLRQEIEEKFNSGRFSWDDMRPHDCAGLLKQFLRDLPIPLLTFQYIEAFAAVQKISDPSKQLQALNLLVLLLPDVHRNTLLRLLQFLKRVVDCKENKMTMNNVAMIMAPNLFLVQSRPGKAQPLKRDLEISMAAGSSNIVKMLIKYQEILWSVPSFMLTQIRHQYEAEQLRSSGNKSIMKFLGRKDKDTPKKPQVQHENDFHAGVIRVQAPHLNMCTTAIQLERNTTAADIVARFCRSSVVQENSCIHDGETAVGKPYLYELGGNIGERRLDGDTNMLLLYRVNPNADWVIMTKPD